MLDRPLMLMVKLPFVDGLDAIHLHVQSHKFVIGAKIKATVNDRPNVLYTFSSYDVC